MSEKYEKKLEQEFEGMHDEFSEKQKEQVQSENQKLMSYISVMREEKKKKSFWSKVFYK
ncbi:MAG: hypothetical protein N4A64_03830 [Marinisporobacter sp.]|jgi:hypothetical protein|nr:hypothetical protein [Marinisporobacter sp.]